MPLDLPPKLWLPPKPAIIQPDRRPLLPLLGMIPGMTGAVAAAASGPAAAVFPVVQATNTSVETGSEVTTHDVSLPASIAAGNLLIVFIHGASLGNVPGFSAPSGWTQLYNLTPIGDNRRAFACFHKTASGSEGATVQVPSSGACLSAHNSYRITGQQGSIEAATATGSGTTPDPPNLTPSWGSDDNLWLAASAHGNGANDLTAPTNYTNIVQTFDSLGETACATARRNLTAASENPGTFANANNVAWGTATVAVRG